MDHNIGDIVYAIVLVMAAIIAGIAQFIKFVDRWIKTQNAKNEGQTRPQTAPTPQQQPARPVENRQPVPADPGSLLRKLMDALGEGTLAPVPIPVDQPPQAPRAPRPIPVATPPMQKTASIPAVVQHRDRANAAFRNIDDLRRGIVMHEILSAPVSMRE
jgi:hypothetical protein